MCHRLSPSVAGLELKGASGASNGVGQRVTVANIKEIGNNHSFNERSMQSASMASRSLATKTDARDSKVKVKLLLKSRNCDIKQD